MNETQSVSEPTGQTKGKSGSSFSKTILKLIGNLFSLILIGIKDVIVFFWDLKLKSKIIFIILIIIVMLVSYYIGIRRGEENIRNEVLIRTGVELDVLEKNK